MTQRINDGVQLIVGYARGLLGAAHRGCGIAASMAWVVALVMFAVVRCSTNAQLHGAAVILGS